ncbi:peptide deformylase [Fontimonas thermophila]|uniref:Peptide deformylase n=1 Tax=Fontimonas thermophila TaxID=1076937 RepID=A0A1I2H0L4_9GAMM|nr:peptide deformylase [Fontimonas thermophila]SFF22839.1 peptide deformylase [Fontimonas thermophila]
MALLTILHHPDPRLRQKAEPVQVFDARLQTLIDDMFETMYAAPGVGLAATQVGVPLRLAVMDCSEDKTRPQPIVIINPQILSPSDPEIMEEGCLSVPGVGEKVERYRRLKLRALDRHGQPFELEAEGLLAQAVQHEVDHLDGKLFIDRLSSLKRERLLKKLRKRQAA